MSAWCGLTLLAAKHHTAVASPYSPLMGWGENQERKKSKTSKVEMRHFNGTEKEEEEDADDDNVQSK